MIPHNVMLLHASLPSNCRFRLVEVLVIFSNASVASSVNGDLMAAFDLSRNGNANLPPPPATHGQTDPPPSQALSLDLQPLHHRIPVLAQLDSMVSQKEKSERSRKMADENSREKRRKEMERRRAAASRAFFSVGVKLWFLLSGFCCYNSSGFWFSSFWFYRLFVSYIDYREQNALTARRVPDSAFYEVTRNRSFGKPMRIISSLDEPV